MAVQAQTQPPPCLGSSSPRRSQAFKPQAKAGWAIEIERESLAVPIPGEGARLVSDRVKAITWRGKLPDDQFDEFGVMARLPATGGPIYFTAVQTCDAIIERWEERPAPGQTSRDLRHPAPMLKLTGAAPVTPVTATAAVPVPLPQNVKLANGALVTATGAPLYLFKHDTMVGMSHCEGECSAAWPPLRALASKPPKGWSKVERVDGSLQWAFQDRPLYTTTLTGSRLAEALAPGGAWAPARVSAGR